MAKISRRLEGIREEPETDLLTPQEPHPPLSFAFNESQDRDLDSRRLSQSFIRAASVGDELSIARCRLVPTQAEGGEDSVRDSDPAFESCPPPALHPPSACTAVETDDQPDLIHLLSSITKS